MNRRFSPQANGQIPFVISSLPRSGSTAVARIVNLHPEIRCLIEPFHPLRYNGRYHQLALRESISGALEELWPKWSGVKHVWEADGWPFCEDPALNEQILFGPDRNVIFLIRRNWLRRLVSAIICAHIRFWIGTRQEFLTRLNAARLPALDQAAVVRQLKYDQSAVARYLEGFKSNGCNARVFYYEDIFGDAISTPDRNAVVNALLGFLGYKPIPLDNFLAGWEVYFDEATFRWATTEVYLRIPGIERLDEEVGSEENGWLFRESPLRR